MPDALLAVVTMDYSSLTWRRSTAACCRCAADFSTWTGAPTIVASGLYSLHREREATFDMPC
ncbi:hypothetical protein QTH97_25865 [Variovorax sp. J22R24]|uniref:hypothetical protein n=1 Tax=Variovorax gracilis TaxID=3053502 RepID=UPI002578D965|nr:hypothetical protein [Variovorax sp. J22R24]MDM0108402.1 hypothetical protein [Variovorax sp. J22R24]